MAGAVASRELVVEQLPLPRGATPGPTDERRPVDPSNDGDERAAPPRRPPWRDRRVIGLVSVLLLVAGAVRAFAGDGATTPALDRRAVEGIVAEKITEAAEAAASAPARSAEVYRVILPSIVVIEATGAGRGSDARADGSLGTGVIVNADGTVLTAAHVIDGATSVRLRFADGTESAATIASADKATDIATLTPATLPSVVVPATLGGGVQVGDETYAVGHPLGLVGSLSAGVISGLDRSIPRGDGAGRLTGLIQFDAAVNPGNSGGPLLDRGGRVVGIVTAIADPSQDGSFIGIGFAVPIATAGGAAGAPPR